MPHVNLAPCLAACRHTLPAPTLPDLPAVPLGGLVGDNIYLVPERVTRLANRLQKWVALRRTPAQVRGEGCSSLHALGQPGTAGPAVSSAPLAAPVTCALGMCVQERKLAILVYGFPPGVGATGTAALLNVPKSLERLLETLRAVRTSGPGPAV